MATRRDTVSKPEFDLDRFRQRAADFRAKTTGRIKGESAALVREDRDNR
jgi:hypothetical protein